MLVSASPASASTAPSPCEPQVAELGAVPFWHNYNDYLERRLTVDESLKNTGGCLPCLLRLAQVEPSDGVSLETTLPIDLGELQPAENITVRMKFRVPAGVSRFQSRARFICGQPAPETGPQPVPGGLMMIKPSFAWANEGCPVLPPAEMAAPELPADLSYGPRLFTATLVDKNGDPVAGKSVKWSLSNNISFRILASTDVTDDQGRATALVTPPQYFICVAPYFSRDLTRVIAISEDSLGDSATFVYSRCLPLTS
ncbi:MAG: Ig-like domain-containing protein [Thermoleophilia bacterium]